MSIWFCSEKPPLKFSRAINWLGKICSPIFQIEYEFISYNGIINSDNVVRLQVKLKYIHTIILDILYDLYHLNFK